MEWKFYTLVGYAYLLCVDKGQPLSTFFYYLKRRTGKMQKVSYPLIEEMTKKNITSNELNVLFYIGRFQDEFGCIKGIHYKEICETLKISVQGFYDALKGLQEKAIITYTHRVSDYDITINGNNKIDTENFKHGYVSLSHPIFRKENFLKLPVKAKLFAIHLVREESIRRKNTKDTSHSMQRNKREFLKKFSDMLGVEKRTVRAYLTLLEEFITVYLENGVKYYLTFKSGIFKEEGKKSKSENDELREHQADCAIRRNRIKNKAKRNGLVRKLSIFTKAIKNYKNFDFSQIVYDSIRQQNVGQSNSYKWSRKINLTIIENIMLETFAALQVADALYNAING